jgi:hypothetical protein
MEGGLMWDKIIKLIVMVSALVVLTACGGGGSDPAPITNTNCVLGSSTIGDCKI